MHRGVFMVLSAKSLSIRSIVFFLLISITVFSLPAGGNAESDRVFGEIRIMDYYGREIVLDEAAETIISLSPGITETVFALGYGHRLVGRTSYCDYPAEAVSVPSLGSLTEPDIEAIVALSPDVVIASTHFPEDALNRLIDAGQNVVVLMGQESFQGTYDGVIRPVSILLGDTKAGEELISSMEATVADALRKVAAFSENPTVYYVVGFGEGGDWTAGGDTFIGQMIEMAGAVNIAADVTGWSFSLELIVDRDPDLILLPDWAETLFKTTPIYSDLRAVGNGNAVAFDENAIVRQGPRLADGFASLVDIIGSAH